MSETEAPEDVRQKAHSIASEMPFSTSMRDYEWAKSALMRAILQERERCAQICLEGNKHGPWQRTNAGLDFAAAIRSAP